VEGLSARAIDLHLGLYRGYVEQVNALLTQLREKPAGMGQQMHDVVARRLAFEWNGMILHEVFFESLRGTGHRLDDSGVFAEALDQSYGGFDAWRTNVTEMAALRGIGWVITAREPQRNRIFNTWVNEHHLGVPAGVQIVFALDLWEHAYLLDYLPEQRRNYVGKILENTDWTVVERRCTVEDLPAA
jgi:Fe-Mn family superoxide dismutase